MKRESRKRKAKLGCLIPKGALILEQILNSRSMLILPRREYCRIPYLVYDDVVAFLVYGTLGLKCPMADHTWNGSSDLKAYIALKNIFIDVMIHLYGLDV